MIMQNKRVQSLLAMTNSQDELARLRAFVRLLAEDTDDIVSLEVSNEACRVLRIPPRWMPTEVQKG